MTTTPNGRGAGRIELCQEAIKETMRCLENGDKDCVMRRIEELVKADCHDGNAVGREVADKVRDVVHELWLVSDNEHRCRLLKMLKDLGTSKTWTRTAARISKQDLDKHLIKCSINWEDKVARSGAVKDIEDLLRERFGWSETRMCEELFKFIGIDVDEFRRYGVEPCVWLEGLEKLSNLRSPYWLGMRASDLVIEKYNGGIGLELGTTNTADGVFFPKILSMVETPSLKIKWDRGIPRIKGHELISLRYYVYLGPNEWPWPIELNTNELERVLNGFSDEELAEFIAGEIDGDGTVLYDNKGHHIFVRISACKACPKRMVLDVLKEVIAKRFGIVGSIRRFEAVNILLFSGEKAIKLLRRVAKYMHHPLRRLRAELILALYDGRISPEVFEKLYEMTEYEYRGSDVKHDHAMEAAIRAAPQWPLGWLATYSGSDCRLWRIVLEKCMESELCRRVIEMLPAIGYSLAEHKCYDPALINDLDTEIITPQQAKSSIAHTT